MPDFLITLERTITRQVRVSAANAAAARREIVDYGVEIAWEDYPAISGTETDKAKLVRVSAVD